MRVPPKLASEVGVANGTLERACRAQAEVAVAKVRVDGADETKAHHVRRVAVAAAEHGDEPHPMAWYKEFDGGRSFYTALGHTEESYDDPLFQGHLWGGISYAAGEGIPHTG